MHLGIVCAMPMEARTLLRRRVVCGEFGRAYPNCTVICSGIGATRAEAAVETLLGQGVEAIISWGCAGGLHPALVPGALLLPTVVLDSEGAAIGVDQALLSTLRAALQTKPDHTPTQIMSSDQAVMSRDQKLALYQRFGAAAIDMESAALGLAAQRNSLPYAAVRVVLDPASQSLPAAVLGNLDTEGHLPLVDTLKRLARHPPELLGMITLAANAFRAQRSLARAASQLAASTVA